MFAPLSAPLKIAEFHYHSPLLTMEKAIWKVTHLNAHKTFNIIITPESLFIPCSSTISSDNDFVSSLFFATFFFIILRAADEYGVSLLTDY